MVKGVALISLNMPAVSLKTMPIYGGNMDIQFKNIYSEMFPKLVRQAAFLLGDPAAAEDLAQEAFLRLHGVGLDTVENPAGWLAKVTNNLCFSYLRKESSRRKREEIVCQQDIFASLNVPSAEKLALHREELQLVQKALGQLQPRDRLVLLMKFSGYSYDEIAATVEINRSSVGTILARARERFKREYQLLLIKGV